MELVNMLKLGTMGFKPADIKQINAAGIETDQIVELAKSGYAVSDVNELIKLAQEPSQTPPEEAPKAQPETPKETPPEKSEHDDKLEQLQKALDEANAKIKQIQSDNASKNLGAGDVKSPRDLVRESLRNLY